MANTQLPIDRGYHALLHQLSLITPTLSLDTLHGALCHYLVNLPPTHPTPAPLTAAVAASPLYQNSSVTADGLLQSLLTLGSVYRTAFQQKWEALKKREPERGLFDASAASEIWRWARGVVSGLKGGDALLRLAISGGLLSCLDFLEDRLSKQIDTLLCDIHVLLVSSSSGLVLSCLVLSCLKVWLDAGICLLQCKN